MEVESSRIPTLWPTHRSQASRNTPSPYSHMHCRTSINQIPARSGDTLTLDAASTRPTADPRHARSATRDV